jgi:hypothetical protein
MEKAKSFQQMEIEQLGIQISLNIFLIPHQKVTQK